MAVPRRLLTTVVLTWARTSPFTFPWVVSVPQIPRSLLVPGDRGGRASWLALDCLFSDAGGDRHVGTYGWRPREIATEITTGTYEFVVSGIGGAVSGFDAEILIPKQNSGYGSKALTVTTRVNDGFTTNEAITETEAFSIFSTIPPAPFVQLSEDIDLTDLSSGVIALDDLVRVAQGNDSHVLNCLDYLPGVSRGPRR